MLGSYYVRFIVVRDTVMLPLWLLHMFVDYLAKTEPSQVKIHLLTLFPFLKKCCGPKAAGAVVIVAAAAPVEDPAPESEKPKPPSE